MDLPRAVVRESSSPSRWGRSRITETTEGRGAKAQARVSAK